jgi:protein-S-isoprenylcysteine O-methyltransferase Ste14
MCLAAQINIWLVFVSVAGYQLFLQFSSRKINPFSEGFAKGLQYLIGIPTLALLVVFFLNSDFRNFAIVAVTLELMVIGAIVFNLAALMILCAHFSLGNCWTGDLGTRSDHHVVESGLYGWIRHPLYTSYFLIVVGFFLMTGDWLLAASMLAYCGAVALRVLKEEEMLLSRLGRSYALYMQRTGRFLPRSKGSIAATIVLSKDRA